MNAQQKFAMFERLDKSHQQLVEFANSIVNDSAAPKAKLLARPAPQVDAADFTDEERAALGDAFNEINDQFAPPAKKQRKEEPEESSSAAAEEEEEEDDSTLKWGAYGEVTEEELKTLMEAVEKKCIDAVDNKLKDRDMKTFMCKVFKWKGSYCQRSRKRGETYTPRELLNIEKIATFIHLALPHFEKEIKARGPHLSGRLGTIRSVLVFNEDEDATEDKKKTIPDDEKIQIELENNPLHVAFKSTEELDKMVELLFKSVLFFRDTLAKPTKAAAKAAKVAALPPSLLGEGEGAGEEEEKKEEEKETPENKEEETK
jgi:hypothetical protein